MQLPVVWWLDVQSTRSDRISELSRAKLLFSDVQCAMISSTGLAKFAQEDQTRNMTFQLLFRRADSQETIDELIQILILYEYFLMNFKIFLINNF